MFDVVVVMLLVPVDPFTFRVPPLLRAILPPFTVTPPAVMLAPPAVTVSPPLVTSAPLAAVTVPATDTFPVVVFKANCAFPPAGPNKIELPALTVRPVSPCIDPPRKAPALPALNH